MGRALVAVAIVMLNEACTVDATGVVTGGDLLFDAAVPQAPAPPSEPPDAGPIVVMRRSLEHPDGVLP